MSSDFVLHITLDELIVSEDNHLYEYWKSRGHFETPEWRSYTNTEITVQLSAEDFQSAEYTPTDAFQYYQVRAENPLRAFYNVYPDSNVSFMGNSWDTATQWATHNIEWYKVQQSTPLSESFTNENTTWKLKITEATDQTGLVVNATAVYNYSNIQDFTVEHSWKEMLERAKLTPALIFTDTFELKPKTRDLKVKIVILDEFGVQKRVDVNRTITLYKPMAAEKRYSSWTFPLYCAASATNINLSPTYSGGNAWMAFDHMESTRASWISGYTNAIIPVSYLEEETPAETVTWYYQERIGIGLSVFTRLAGHSQMWDNGSYFITVNKVYERGTDAKWPISYVDQGNAWAFALNTDILPDDQGAT